LSKNRGFPQLSGQKTSLAGLFPGKTINGMPQKVNLPWQKVFLSSLNVLISSRNALIT